MSGIGYGNPNNESFDRSSMNSGDELEFEDSHDKTSEPPSNHPPSSTNNDLDKNCETDKIDEKEHSGNESSDDSSVAVNQSKEKRRLSKFPSSSDDELDKDFETEKMDETEHSEHESSDKSSVTGDQPEETTRQSESPNKIVEPLSTSKSHNGIDLNSNAQNEIAVNSLVEPNEDNSTINQSDEQKENDSTNKKNGDIAQEKGDVQRKRGYWKMAGGWLYSCEMFNFKGINRIDHSYDSRPIIGRITNVGPIKTTKYSCLVHFSLEHDGETMDAIAFGSRCQKFVNALKLHEVYVLDHYEACVNNQQYSFTDGEFAIKLTANTTVMLMENECVPKICKKGPMSFVYSSNLYKNVDKQINMCVAILSVGEMETVTIESDQRETTRRTIMLADDMGYTFHGVLWGEAAIAFPQVFTFPKAVIITGLVQICNYGIIFKIRQLGDINWTPFETSYTRVIVVRKWMKEHQPFRMHGFENLSEPITIHDETPHPKKTVWPLATLIQHANNKMLPYKCQVIVMIINIITKIRKMVFRSCPKHGMKLVAYDPAQPPTYCFKCRAHVDETHFSAFFTVHVSDYSGGTIFKFFKTGTERLFGKNITELGLLSENDRPLFEKTIKKILYKHYAMSVQLHINNNKNVRYVQALVVDAKPANETNRAIEARCSSGWLANIPDPIPEPISEPNPELISEPISAEDD